MLRLCKNTYDHIIEDAFAKHPGNLDQAINASIKEIRKFQLEELINGPDRSTSQIPALISTFAASDLSENMKIFLLSDREFYNRNSSLVDSKIAPQPSTHCLNKSATNGEPYFFYASNNPELFNNAIRLIDLNQKSTNGETLWNKLCSEANSQDIDIHKLQMWKS